MSMVTAKHPVRLDSGTGNRWLRMLRNYQLYLMILPALLYFIIFCYGPMYGLQIAFRDYKVRDGIAGSAWVGLKHFQRLVNAPTFWMLVKNTLHISIYTLLVGFPFPVLLALVLNEVRSSSYKRIVQTVSYAPHFISSVVMVSMIIIFLNPSYGIINEFRKLLGYEALDFMTKPQWFSTIYVLSDVWQNAGWNAIIYLSALAGVDPELHEAAMIDGASRLKRIWHINLPCILPTIIIMLIMAMGRVMSVGFEKVFLMQNPLNTETSEVISTYTYKIGLQNAQYSFSAAVGLFNSVINFILLAAVNQISKRVSHTSLW